MEENDLTIPGHQFFEPSKYDKQYKFSYASSSWDWYDKILPSIVERKHLVIKEHDILNYMNISIAYDLVNSMSTGDHWIMDYVVIFDGYALKLKDFHLSRLADLFKAYMKKYSRRYLYVYQIPRFEFEGF